MGEKKYGWFVWLETKFNEFNMMAKSVILLLIIGLFAQITLGVIIVKLGMYDINTSPISKILNLLVKNFPNSFFSSSFNEFRDFASNVTKDFLYQIFVLFLITFPINIFIIYISLKFSRIKTKEISDRQYIRGAKMITENEAKEQAKKFKSNFTLGQIPLPEQAETEHLLIIGSSGAGKTQLIKKPIMKAIDTNTHGIIHDIKGDWISEFYREDIDIILNPMDKRSVKWTLWNDIENVLDIKNFTNWIVPDLPGAKDPFWQNSARMILESMMLYLYDNDLLTNYSLKKLLFMKEEELAELLKGYGKGANLVLKKDSFNTLLSQMGFIDFLDDGDFSIREWVKNKQGYMFLSNTEQTQAMMKPVLSLAVNIVGSTLLNLPDNRDRRFYVFLDEFTSLTKLDKILDLLKLGRSKGASVWLAFQDFQQTEKIYSKEDMRTIINNTATIAVLRLKEPDAAAYFSKRFARMEFIEKNKTTSMGVAQNRDGLSITEQQKDDFVVKDSEILTIQPLNVFMSIAHIDGVVKTKVDIQKVDIKNVPLDLIQLSKQEQIKMLTIISALQEQTNINSKVVKNEDEKNDILIESSQSSFLTDELENMF